jgi:chromosome segregation ATPase
MSGQSRIRCNSCCCGVLIVLLLCGCNAPEESTNEPSTSRNRAEASRDVGEEGAVVAHRETDAASGSDADADGTLVRQARIRQATTELGAARAQQTELMRKQAEMSARLEAQQEEGLAMLASLKADMAKLQALDAHSAGEGSEGRDAAARVTALEEQLSTDARARLEPLLVQDQALFAELEAVSAELDSAGSRVEALRAELAALQSADPVNLRDGLERSPETKPEAP